MFQAYLMESLIITHLNRYYLSRHLFIYCVSALVYLLQVSCLLHYFGVGDAVLLVLRRLACPVLMNHAREWYRSAADAVPCWPRDLLPQGAARASVGHMRWCVWWGQRSCSTTGFRTWAKPQLAPRQDS